VRDAGRRAHVRARGGAGRHRLGRQDSPGGGQAHHLRKKGSLGFACSGGDNTQTSLQQGSVNAHTNNKGSANSAKLQELADRGVNGHGECEFGSTMGCHGRKTQSCQPMPSVNAHRPQHLGSARASLIILPTRDVDMISTSPSIHALPAIALSSCAQHASRCGAARWVHWVAHPRPWLRWARPHTA
jgi:hypothetical protein